MTMRGLAFSGGRLDRAHDLRRDEAAVARAWRAPAALIVPVWRGQCLLTPDGAAALPPAAGRPDDLPWALLGLDDGAPVFGVDLSGMEAPLDALPPDAGQFGELRPAAARLPTPDAALLAYASALMRWRGQARFCGVCGAATEPGQGGHVVHCTACKTAFFPRTDPTVIMLVHHGVGRDARVLLAHNVRFPNRRVYSVLAGFVEPGESLEEAVAREVAEETGLRLGAITYRASQPWPFPANLMLAFVAEALGDGLRVDPEELDDAAWFSRADLVAGKVELPPMTAIARRLIEEWLNS